MDFFGEKKVEDELLNLHSFIEENQITLPECHNTTILQCVFQTINGVDLFFTNQHYTIGATKYNWNSIDLTILLKCIIIELHGLNNSKEKYELDKNDYTVNTWNDYLNHGKSW